MCVESWGRIGFARALIKVSVEKELKQVVKMVVPLVEGTGYTNEHIRVEYEWKPPICLDCHVFGHSLEKYPKCLVVAAPVTVNMEDQNEGFTTVNNISKEGKKAENVQAKHIAGLKLNQPKSTFLFHPKATQPDDKSSEVVMGESSRGNVDISTFRDPVSTTLDSDSEVEEAIIEYISNVGDQKGVRQVVNENHLSVSAIIESHADLSALLNVCSRVFRYWDWTSNANLCPSGCRIIVDWNLDVVDLLVISQSKQALYVRMLYKATNKTFFCSFIYAGNTHYERHLLWSGLGLHKHMVRDLPWILLDDFNATLNMENTFLGSSIINAAMCEFKECVAKIEVLDINCSGLHYTWNQKPRGSCKILKKLDCIMGNMEFIDAYPGAYALFQPYRISDHSSAVLKIPNLISSKPKPFKFYNFLTNKSKFLELLSTHWYTNVPGHSMFKVVSKLKSFKKPLRKLLQDHGNLHDRVTKLRHELDKVQKALDINPADLTLCEEERVYIQAFNEAKLDEERFLKQKAKADCEAILMLS
ncbi:trichome birefringence-like protein 3 [Tanacetum coccineum]|uniref:Trichome birefringence-like protein 3 n=1 Tax=Tanacetum coccineum TaxID=301880 RepID=A0ABQ5ET49_9ASTR